MFQLNSPPLPNRRYSKGRIAVVEAFLDRPTWDRKTVEKVDNLINKRQWEKDSPQEWLETLERAAELIAGWQKIDRLAPAGSLRHALVREPRRERMRKLHNKLYEYERRRTQRVRELCGYKEYKTQAARRKQWVRLETALNNDPVLKRIRGVGQKLWQEVRY